MKSVLLILGTRPEAIKMAPLLLSLRTCPAISAKLLHTGQHETMADLALSAFGITPDLRLPPPPPQRTHAELVAHLLTHLSQILQKERPHLVLVHGDTASAHAATLACFYEKLPVAHIEAGLRSGSLDSPFPEEYNRRAIALTASLHFAPTESARENLLRESVQADRIFVVGNTVIDALRYTVRTDFDHPLLRAAHGKKILLFTAHRKESQGAPMEGMLCALKQLVDIHKDTVAILPMHPNPSVQQLVRRHLANTPRVFLTEPMEVSVCHNLLAHTTLLLTDSGGLQEEATALGIPTLVMREHTERSEGLADTGGSLFLVGRQGENIFQAANRLLTDPDAYAKAAQRSTAFGDGHASERITALLAR